MNQSTRKYFTNKKVWITGASSGIGREIALQLAPYVNSLILTARNTKKLDALANEIQVATLVLPCDLSDETAVSEMLKDHGKVLADVNFVFLNAGISQRSLAKDTEMSVVRQVMDVNFFGTVQLSQFIVSYIKSNEGKIIVISSVAGKFGVPFRSTYCASKHALHGYFEAVRIEEDVDVLLVCPGFIETDISKNAVTGTGAIYGEMDDGQANGMPVDKAVSKILEATRKGKKEIFIGGFRETKLAVFMHKNFPSIFFKILRKTKVK